MVAGKESKRDPFQDLFSPLHPTEAELAAIRKAERAGDLQEFVKKVGELDRKYKVRSLDALKNVERGIMKADTFRRATWEGRMPAERPIAGQIGSILGGLLGGNELACDCVVPFRFRRLDVYTNMSGPETAGVRSGILGANREYTNEYTVWNPGDTDGKARVHLPGQIHISFSAQLPRGGRWCLLLPSGDLWVRGHSRVVGHGNSTTSYDAKVWVDYYQVLVVGNTLLEMSGGPIHYDGTRSEDRTRNFDSDRYLQPRYTFFNAQPGDQLELTLRLEIDTAANEDGLATGVVDYFGFPANTDMDYDTFVIKAA